MMGGPSGLHLGGFWANVELVFNNILKSLLNAGHIKIDIHLFANHAFIFFNKIY
jgi:hypothetical protein